MEKKLGTLNLENDLVDMTHGAGGKNSFKLVQQIFSDTFQRPELMDKNNYLQVPDGELVVTTDSFVISPLFFSGGDIGSLSIHGTLNDLSMCGAIPLGLCSSFIIEEGFPLAELKKIAESMFKAQKESNIWIQSGDTKVVEKGKGDGVFITTTGFGFIPKSRNKLSLQNIKPRDKIIVSGTVGDHGIAIMSQRSNLEFHTKIKSDSAALHSLTDQMFSVAKGGLRYMQDPTRGGLSGCLNEVAFSAGLELHITSDAIPVKTEVRAACELLGIDPLGVANEGKLVAICDPNVADVIISEMKKHSLGIDAAIIGEVSDVPKGRVILNTTYGSQKILNWNAGEQLPRIC